MNFLAHAYLSGDDSGLLVGNFIADFVKGRSAVEEFQPEIRRGIYLHRVIDSFTDTHAVVTESKKRLREKYRHYAGVIVDVFYDHFLARNWDTYHPMALSQYVAKTYRIIDDHKAVLPEAVKTFFPYMVHGNWLLNYAHLEGIGRTLTGMSKRTPFESRMEIAVEDLERYYEQFQDEFSRFFPELKQHVADYLSTEDS